MDDATSVDNARYYFEDVGLANYLYKMSKINKSNQSGRLTENFVFRAILDSKSFRDNMPYFALHGDKELDFFAFVSGSKKVHKVAVEVKNQQGGYYEKMTQFGNKIHYDKVEFFRLLSDETLPIDESIKLLFSRDDSTLFLFVNNVFNKSYDPKKAKVIFENTEFISSEFEDIRADLMFSIDGDSYHIEFQTQYDKTMVIRVFEYGSNRAVLHLIFRYVCYIWYEFRCVKKLFTCLMRCGIINYELKFM